MHEDGENLPFSIEIAVYFGHGTRQAHGYYKKSQIDNRLSVPMTLSDLERRDARSQFFGCSYLRMLIRFDLERPNLAW